MKILFTGGGTGGHIFPIVAVERELRKAMKGKIVEFSYLGPKDNFAKILLSDEGIKVNWIMTGKIRRYFSFSSFFQNIIDVLFKIPLGIVSAFFRIFFSWPDLIFSKGGFGSLPVVVAGWLLRVPIFLHESDTVAGLANKISSHFALQIFTSFPKTLYLPPQKMILVGNPIRKELLQGSHEEARSSFNLSREKPVILLLGGSQGAQRINDKMISLLPQLLSDFELIHQCGEKNFKEVKIQSGIIIPPQLKKYYHLFPFLKEDNLKLAYAAADLIISRAGSGTIFEIAALGKPSILIPLPESAQGHQIKNAYTYAKNGAAMVLEEGNFTSHFFLERVHYIFSHPEEMEKMRKAAKEFAKPRAAEIIAQYIAAYLK